MGTGDHMPPPEGRYGEAPGGPPPGGPPPPGPRPASVGKRVGAYIIDAIGVSIVLFILFAVLRLGGPGMMGARGGDGQGLLGAWVVGLLGSALFLAYFAVMESSRGQTVGKMLVNIRVVAADGGPVDAGSAVLRRIPFVIGSVIPLVGGLVNLVLIIAVLVTVVQDQVNRGFHDKWADTTVIEA